MIRIKRGNALWLGAAEALPSERSSAFAPDNSQPRRPTRRIPRFPPKQKGKERTAAPPNFRRPSLRFNYRSHLIPCTPPPSFYPPRLHRAPLTDRTGARNHPRTSAAFANEPLQTSNERPLQIKNQGGHFWRKKAPNKQTLYLYGNKYKFFFFFNPTRQTNSEAKNIAQFPPPSRLFHRCCTPKIAPRKGGKIKGRKSPPLPHPPARRASIVYVLAVPICFYVRLSGPIARTP